MAEPVKQDTLLRRKEVMDYIYGLIRYEMHKGEDSEGRLQVLSNIHWDLNFLEDLQHSKGWYGKKSGKGDELYLTSQKLENYINDYNELLSAFKELTEFIGDNQTKKDIVQKSEEIAKKTLQAKK